MRPQYQSYAQGLCPPGIEYYLPLFFEETATLFDYLPADTLIVVDNGVEEAADRFHREVHDRHESLRHDRERPLCTPAEVFLLPNEVFAAVKAHPSIMVLGPLGLATVVNLIANTTTEAGLHIDIDGTVYEKGIAVSEKEMEPLNIKRDKFHGEWNYKIMPQK